MVTVFGKLKFLSARNRYNAGSSVTETKNEASNAVINVPSNYKASTPGGLRGGVTHKK